MTSNSDFSLCQYLMSNFKIVSFVASTWDMLPLDTERNLSTKENAAFSLLKPPQLKK